MGGGESKKQAANDQSRLDKATSQITSLSSSIKELKEALNNKQTDIGGYQTRIQQLEKERQDVKRELEKELRKRDITIDELQKSNCHLAKQVLELKNNLETMQEEFRKEREETRIWLRRLEMKNQLLQETVTKQQETIGQQQVSINKQQTSLAEQQAQTRMLLEAFLQQKHQSSGSENLMISTPEKNMVMLKHINTKYTKGLEVEDMGFSED